MKSSIEGKRILITGGTGSFGNRVAAFLVQHNPREIVIYSRDEKKQWEMTREFPDFRYLVGDVRDRDRLYAALQGVDLVFHAAALKQVPACEDHPFEAVKTNVVGSNNLCEAARDRGVAVVVALSTDKAVKPVNAMGISKALMEKIVTSQNRFPVATKFCCTRYGNVMGTRGSVIPLFLRLIEERKPLTITDPRMTRFLMTLGESVELVLHAMTRAEGGEVFVRKAPAVHVIDLAHAMLKKYGDGDLGRIRITGIRPGEKLDEVLVNEYEMTRAFEGEEYFTIFPEYREVRQEKQTAGAHASLDGGASWQSPRKRDKAEIQKAEIEQETGDRRQETGGSRYEFGYEYTSANTRIVTDHAEIGAMLDRMGKTEYYI